MSEFFNSLFSGISGQFAEQDWVEMFYSFIRSVVEAIKNAFN